VEHTPIIPPRRSHDEQVETDRRDGTVQIGSIEILPVIDATFRHPPMTTYLGSAAHENAWEIHRYLLDDDGQLESSMGGFLIRGGGSERVALVDLGLGDNDMMGARGGAMLESLRGYGLEPEDVTDVLFTHLHLDHIGWASVAGQLVFPNATYRCDTADWDYWVVDPPDAAQEVPKRYFRRQKELMDPAEARLETWDRDGPVLPGIDVLQIPGHTPGSSMLVVSDGDERALLLGDVVHCAVELLEDEWDGFADVDPVQAKAARNALARELERSDTPVAAAHFPNLRFGRVLPGERARRFEFL
jgi:glyoxylase-like metal-dependent hydrolase (beta-lactamase superfamily II)